MAPIIVPSNAVKDMINEAAAQTFTHVTGQELHWYYCMDLQNGSPLNPFIRHFVENLHSGKTSYHLARLLLVIGMPTMITHNFDVQSEIVNSCSGTLTHINYTTNMEGHCHAILCVVHTPFTSGEMLPHLQPFHSIVLEDTIDIVLYHPHSKQSFKFKYVQLLLVL